MLEAPPSERHISGVGTPIPYRTATNRVLLSQTLGRDLSSNGRFTSPSHTIINDYLYSPGEDPEEESGDVSENPDITRRAVCINNDPSLQVSGSSLFLPRNSGDPESDFAHSRCPSEFILDHLVRSIREGGESGYLGDICRDREAFGSIHCKV